MDLFDFEKIIKFDTLTCNIYGANKVDAMMTEVSLLRELIEAERERQGGLMGNVATEGDSCEGKLCI